MVTHYNKGLGKFTFIVAMFKTTRENKASEIKMKKNQKERLHINNLQRYFLYVEIFTY